MKTDRRALKGNGLVSGAPGDENTVYPTGLQDNFLRILSKTFFIDEGIDFSFFREQIYFGPPRVEGSLQGHYQLYWPIFSLVFRKN